MQKGSFLYKSRYYYARAVITMPESLFAQESLLAQAIDLMLYGMGTVYVFLGLLIAVTTLISKWVVRLFPDPLPKIKPTKTTTAKPVTEVDAATLRVIRAALDQHRARH